MVYRNLSGIHTYTHTDHEKWMTIVRRLKHYNGQHHLGFGRRDDSFTNSLSVLISPLSSLDISSWPTSSH